MNESITILGDGAMGTVCSILASAGGHRAVLWGAFEESVDRLKQNRENTRLLPGVRIPDGVLLTANPGEAFAECSLIISAIPTQYLGQTFARLAGHIPAGVPIVSATKGIENETLRRPTQIIEDALACVGKRNPLAVLSGPNIAAELARYQPASCVVASTDDSLCRRVQSAMSTQWFRIYTNADVIGVELAGASKNVIALAAGMVDGLRAGDNAKSALVTRGLVEITRLGVALGARAETFMGLAGLGDLITTCVSPEGRNRRVGEQLGRGRKLSEILSEMKSVAEGVATTRSIHALALRAGVEMPITRQVYAVLFEDKDVLAALGELMSRAPRSEQ
jgi:glycerol-3-phosphate dehydrogenase (NAD(P)+)